MSDRNVFSSNEAILGGSRNSFFMLRAGHRKEQKIGTSIPILQSQEKREGLEVELIIDHTCVVKPPLKISKL